MIDDLLENWLAAVKSKNIDALVSLVTEDCVFLAPGAPPIRGRDKVRETYSNLFRRYHVVQQFHFEEFQSMGDWAFGWGTDDIIVTPIDAGPAVRFAGHGVSILRREGDGMWRFARGINNATQQKS
jgi:uncharacterized protein (TIGR02246 family)